MTTSASPISPAVGSHARALTGDLANLQVAARRALSCRDEARSAVEASFKALRSEMVRRELSNIPVSRLKDSTAGRLRLGQLEKSRFRTVLDVLDASSAALQAVPGVGERTAVQAHAAARQVAAAVDDGLQVRIDLDPTNPRSTALLQALWRLDCVESTLTPIGEHLQRATTELGPLLDAARPTAGKVRFFFTGSARKVAATDALTRLQHWASWTQTIGLRTGLDAVEEASQRLPSPSTAWADFQRRSPEFYGLLGEVVDLKLDVAAAEGFLPAEIAERVKAQKLDETFRTVSLRGYQSFGARFALVQRHVIIGDEMGLGKTIQAIAAMAHLKATGATHFLVVCPASVLVNWTREIAQRSTMRAYRLHGPDRVHNLARWTTRGDIGVTTFESLRNLDLPAEAALAMLVVDEAHYVKNPQAQRSRTITQWTGRAKRVLFLTGTPMENRVEEFKSLVDYLQPELAPRINGRHGIAGPDAFRQAVAPVYLRRNQRDVLTELPELIQIDEWEEFGKRDFEAYRAAVTAGNFMAMRRAAYAVPDPRHSAKLQRLLEIADEAGDNGHKVVVFSFFRDVLDTVHNALGPRAYGPLTGSVPPDKRQALVDDFQKARGPAVLVSQIQAGGVGLNMQAASVVVLCEPQVKPTMESQAIARAHRMGQLRSVQVHRLLIADSVDQRMLEILDAKARLFDQYARRAALTESAPDALDISEVALARQVVAAEQERLALQLMAELNGDPIADDSQEVFPVQDGS